VIKDVIDIKPEAAFIGHGHGDHADNAAFIAAKAGTKLYMSPEACGTAQTALTRMKNDPFMQADPWFAIPQNTTIDCTGMTTPARCRRPKSCGCASSIRSCASSPTGRCTR
jgi:glyoxylase-like metal-dependent hydrolase (beta-lactamase superfamily II)